MKNRIKNRILSIAGIVIMIKEDIQDQKAYDRSIAEQHAKIGL